MTTKTPAKNIRGQQDGQGTSKRSSELNHNEIRRAKKAHQKNVRGNGGAAKSSTATSTCNKRIVGLAVKAVKEYDTARFVAKRAESDRDVLRLAVGSPAEAVALKVIDFYRQVETVTGLHRARMNALKAEMSRRYPAPTPAQRLGIAKAISALEAAGKYAEQVRKLDLQRAANAKGALAIVQDLAPEVLTESLLAELVGA